MSAQSLLQQIDQECQGLNYEALLKKAKDPIPFNGGYTYPHEAARARALPILDKAIALEPNKAKAYAMKGEMIYKTFLEGQFPSYTPLNVNKESYLGAFENVHKAWTLEPNERDYVRKMRYMFNPPFEFYCPGKLTSIKQHLTDDQVNLVAKVIVDTYTYTETDQKISDKFDLFKEVYELVLTILLVYTNKDLLNFKINLTNFLITYDTQTNLGGYEVDQAASFLDLGEDDKGKSVYQDLLAREPNFRFSANDSIFKDPYKSIEHRLEENMIFLMNFIKMDPTYPYSYYTIGRIIEVHFQHETAKAIEYYSKAESLIKDEIFTWQSDCLCRLARILSIDAKFQQALIAINKAQAIEPSNPKVGLEKGRILKSCGQVSSAFFEFERAQKLAGEVGKKPKEDIAKVSEAILKEKEELLRYFGSKIMQDQVDKVKETLDYDSVAQMKKDMAKIQANQALKDYYDQFVFAFSSLYGTSQVVISGQLSLDTSNTWLDLGAKALSLLPFYGDTIEAIFSTITKQLIGADMKKKAQLFCLLAVNQSELDNTVSYIARKIVLNSIKRRRIVKLNSNKQEKETVSEFWEKMNKFYAKFKSVAGFEDYKLRSNTPAAKLALKDTATLISRIIKNESLLKKTSEERSDEIVDLFFDMEEEALEKETEAKTNITNIIPVQTTAGRFGGCFGRSTKTK